MSTRLMGICWPIQMRPTDKAVLISLADNAWDNGYCFPSIAKICERTCLSKRAVIDAIKRLETGGYLVADRSNGRHTSYTLTIEDRCATSTGALDAPVHDAYLTGAPHAPNRCATRTLTVKNRKEPSKKNKRVARPDSVSEQAWNDWLAVRKAKRAGPVTQTVIKRMQTEAGLAGISLQAAVEEAAARGWQAFKAEWVSGGRPSKVTEAEDFVAKLTGRARHADADGRAIRPTAGVLRDAGDAVDVEWTEPGRGEGGVG